MSMRYDYPLREDRLFLRLLSGVILLLTTETQTITKVITKITLIKTDGKHNEYGEHSMCRESPRNKHKYKQRVLLIE